MPCPCAVVVTACACPCSYKILAVDEVNRIKDDKEATAAVLTKIELDAEKFRLGLTKACSMAGTTRALRGRRQRAGIGDADMCTAKSLWTWVTLTFKLSGRSYSWQYQ